MGADSNTQHLINQIPDPTTRRVVQILVEMIMAEIAKKADAD